jgi:hypothetical protein
MQGIINAISNNNDRIITTKNVSNAIQKRLPSIKNEQAKFLYELIDQELNIYIKIWLSESCPILTPPSLSFCST